MTSPAPAGRFPGATPTYQFFGGVVRWYWTGAWQWCRGDRRFRRLLTVHPGLGSKSSASLDRGVRVPPVGYMLSSVTGLRADECDIFGAHLCPSTMCFDQPRSSV